MDWASSVDFINGGLHNDKLGGLNSASTWPGSSVLSKDHITYWSFDPPGNPGIIYVHFLNDIIFLLADNLSHLGIWFLHHPPWHDIWEDLNCEGHFESYACCLFAEKLEKIKGAQ